MSQVILNGKCAGRGRARAITNNISNAGSFVTNENKAVPSIPPLPHALQPNNILPKILTHLRAYDSNNNMVRNINPIDDDLCRVCERDDRSVFCKSCGNEWKGRMKMECQKHPKTVYLQDHTQCPECKSDNIEESY